MYIKLNVPEGGGKTFKHLNERVSSLGLYELSLCLKHRCYIEKQRLGVEDYMEYISDM